MSVYKKLTLRLKMKGRKEYSMQMVTKRGWWWWWRGAIHISEKIDFKSTVTRDKGHYIMIKGSIH